MINYFRKDFQRGLKIHYRILKGYYRIIKGYIRFIRGIWAEAGERQMSGFMDANDFTIVEGECGSVLGKDWARLIIVFCQ